MDERQQQPELLQLIDEEEWFNVYGLRAANDGENNGAAAEQRAIRDQVNLEQAYQSAIHAKIFAAEDEESLNSKQQRRKQQLDEWVEDEIDILTSSISTSTSTLTSPTGTTKPDTTKIETIEKGSTTNISGFFAIRTNLKELASHSDTVFALASSKHLYNCNTGVDDSTKNSDNKRLSLSLCDYSTDTVKIFLKVLYSSSNYIIAPDFVIDCLKLSHYLQCSSLLNRIVDEYLLTSIDNDNCRFLCILSDELSLPNLWEASVNHMLSRLDQFGTSHDMNNNHSNDDDDTNGDNGSYNLWNDMNPTLRKEIQALRGILKSSNRKQIYFSTYHEYLALLAEQHQYYKERLQDAQDSYNVRYDEETSLRKVLKSLRDEQNSNFGGGYTNSRLKDKIAEIKQQLNGLKKAREYVKPKIDRQERKVDTLKGIMEEQKKIFGER